MPEKAKPLDGIKVIELGTLIAGPFATRILAEFGAEVVKIESPDGGDPLRRWRVLHGDTSLWWYLQARNKKSVTLDLKHPAGQDIVRRLARKADMLVENFRPGVLEKLGLGWEQLSAENPPAWSWCAFPATARPGRTTMRERTGNVMPGITPSNIYATCDSRNVIIGANGDAIFQRFMLAIGQPDLAGDAQLADNAGRSARADELYRGDWRPKLPG